jgi:CheY-like chemotaxis protein
MNPHRPIRVLIVEDDPMVGEMIRGMLEAGGYLITGQALDGMQAIQFATAQQPDVILMDLEMPGMGGIEATQKIQEFCPAPVVILTAYENQELVEQASQVGVGAYLIKPPDDRQIERAITVAMARFSDMRALRRLNTELHNKNEALETALDKVKLLSGMLPICANCKKIRDDQGYWQEVEVYVRDHSEADFSHGLCPDCIRKLYPDLVDKLGL